MINMKHKSRLWRYS